MSLLLKNGQKINKLKSIIKIQNRFREIKTKLILLTDSLVKIKNYIHSILSNIQNNYDNNIISKEKYTEYIELISDINNSVIDLPQLPLTLHSLKEISTLSLQIQLTNILDNIYAICKKTGMINVSSILKLLCGIKWLNTIPDECFNLIVFYDKYMSTFKVDIIDENMRDETEEILEIAKNEGFTNPRELPFSTRSYPTITKSFTEKIEGIKLYVPYYVPRNGSNNSQRFIKITGFFKKDSLNIAKREIPFIKKYNNVKLSLEHMNIPDTFKFPFLEQMSLRDFISNNENEILNKIKNNWGDLKRIKDKSLAQVVKEFTKSTLEKQRKIIIILLLSESPEDQFLAHIVYDMISNDSSLLKKQPMADFIYKSMHWTIQKRFKLTSNIIDNEEKRIKDLSEDDIPIEKRISLLKANDKVKSKAYNKLKEMQGTKESSTKARSYLEGLLKVPFGVFKKESILSFLEDFKFKIKSKIPLLYGLVENTENSLYDFITEIKNIYEKCKNDLNTENEINIFMLKLVAKMEDLDLMEGSKSPDNSIDLTESTENIGKIEVTYNLNKQLVKECVEQIKNIQEVRKVLILNNVSNIDSLRRIETELNNIEHKLGINSPKNNNKRINNFDNYDTAVNNVSKIYDVIDELVKEWNEYKNKKMEYLKNVRKNLDDCVYGHDECKQHIERIVGQWMNGKMEGTVFGMQGPPGTGKTTIAKQGIAKCLIDVDGEPRPFCFLPLGGSSNGSTLEGHNYTYLGSTWGKIIDMIMEAKCMNPIIYIDEIDKVSGTEHGREIISILTHLTDPSQNKEFSDRYFSGIKFDLSKAIFIFSYNDRSKIDRILLDRITEIKIRPISNSDKVKITKDYLMPEILDQVGFKRGDIILKKSEISFIVENYTFEAGVRKLKEKLYEIVREINLKIIMDEKVELPHIVDQQEVEDIFSNNNKVIIKKCSSKPHVGMVNGLYATAMGTGGLTIIEVHRTLAENKLALELTGSQGDVMKESMKVAKTLAWNVIPDDIKKKINDEWEENGAFGLHIHCPEGATPKDGPSAGAAITCGIISRLCNLPIRNDVAMTGEINLRGQVTAIGGVDSKVDGAKRAGAKFVLLPKDNKHDYEKYVKKVKESLCSSGDFTMEQVHNIKAIFIEKIEDLIPYIFVENDLKFNFQ